MNNQRVVSEDMSQSDRMELWGNLIDAVEDWLSEKGIKQYDIPNDERDGIEDAAIIFGSDYDYLADQFANVIGISRDCVEDTNDILKSETKLQSDEDGMLSWAENEVRIACEHERGDKPEDEWDYGYTCYESALKAYKAMAEEEHSGFSWNMTRQIFDRLAKGMPLTPIEDTDDVWNDVSRFCGEDDPYKLYQCKRMSSLFKYVYDDGRVEYKDVDRFCCYNKSEDYASYHSGLVDRVMYEKFPITMPYYPGGDAIKVVCEDYLTDCKNGDFDTVGILYAIKPDGERIEINCFFKEDGNNFKEISVEEYHDRIAMHEEREKIESESRGELSYSRYPKFATTFSGIH